MLVKQTKLCTKLTRAYKRGLTEVTDTVDEDWEYDYVFTDMEVKAYEGRKCRGRYCLRAVRVLLK